MTDHMLERRVDILEQALLGPAGVVAQLGAMRVELKADISRVEAGLTSLTTDIERVRTELTATVQDVKTELKADIEQLSAHMRLLHEDALERIARGGGPPATPVVDPTKTRKGR